MNVLREEFESIVLYKSMDGRSWYYLWKLYVNEDVQSRLRHCLDRSQMRGLWDIAVALVGILVIDELLHFNAEDMLKMDVLMNKIKM